MAIREVIIPLKKHLVKFIQADWDKIDKLEDKSHENRCENFRVILVHSDFQAVVPLILGENFRLLSYNYPIWDDAIEVNNILRKDLIKEPILKKFSDDGYRIIKVKFHTKFRPYSKEERIDLQDLFGSNAKNFRLINKLLEASFRLYIVKSIYGNHPNSRLDWIYNFLRLKETDIKKSTLLRYYHRKKKEIDESPTQKALFTFDKEKPNTYFFKIIEERNNEKSYAKIADKFKISKTKIIRICKTPKIQQEYIKYISNKK